MSMVPVMRVEPYPGDRETEWRECTPPAYYADDEPLIDACRRRWRELEGEDIAGLSLDGWRKKFQAREQMTLAIGRAILGWEPEGDE